MKIEKEVTRHDLLFAALLAAQEFYTSMQSDTLIERKSERDIEITNTNPEEVAIFHCDIITKILAAIPGVTWYFCVKDGRPMIRIY